MPGPQVVMSAGSGAGHKTGANGHFGVSLAQSKVARKVPGRVGGVQVCGAMHAGLSEI